MPGKQVVVVAAINGGMQQDREGARIPCTPAEIAEEAHRSSTRPGLPSFMFMHADREPSEIPAIRNYTQRSFSGFATSARS